MSRNSMEQHILRIDDKDLLYKKLIKLPTTYYTLEKNGNVCTVHSHGGTVEVGDINDLKLQKQGDEIVLCTGDSPLKLNCKDFVIEQKAITGKNQENIIKQLKSGKEALISRKDIKNSKDFAIEFIIGDDDGTELTGMLSFINFNDENDPVLQNIKKETGGLYFTIKENDTDCSRTVYISDQNGNRLTKYNGYQYQYKPDVA
ncbi:MAG: hypothetical protein ACR5LA_12400 [Wolbachia sp.]